MNGFNNGEFTIYVNSERFYTDEEIGDNVRKTVSFALSRGPAEIILVYEKFNSPGYEDLNAVVDYFEVRGTALSARGCYPCRVGFSGLGADECESCPMNTYYDSTVGDCVNCGENEWAPDGSTSKDACKEKRPCQEHDYQGRFGSCINGERSKSYSWILPKTCDDEDGDVLPPMEHGLECAKCNSGHYHAVINQAINETVCAPCEDGTYMPDDEYEELQCLTCYQGGYAPRAHNTTVWTE